jgi:hypothetical protein
MIDITGRTLLRQPLQIMKGKNAISVNIPALPAGTYLVRMPGLKTTKVLVMQ